MSLVHQPKNGLLLLLQAARKLDEDEINRFAYGNEKWEHKHRNSLSESCDKYDKYSCMHPYGLQKRQVPTVRCTHNELEKSRRAHLRTCMEALKEHLNFDNDIPRITMLTVLRKATATIQYLKQKNQSLETLEENEKQRCIQLLKRRQALRKKLEEKRNRTLKPKCWKERNRNCSECSIATTSSDDSEIELRSGSRSRQSPPTQSISGFQTPKTAAAGLHNCVEDTDYLPSLPKSAKSFSPPQGVMSTSPVVPDAYDASSLDSGFEDMVARDGVLSPERHVLTYFATERSQCAPAYSSNLCQAC